MKIWLVTIGEPVPLDSNFTDRLHRTGYFASFLQRRGHDVHWWTSNFDHFRKKHISEANKKFELYSGLTLHLLDGGGYKRNISLERIRDHGRIAKLFVEFAKSELRPEVIVAAYPSIELAHECVKLGKLWDIPVIVDVRDLWPDIFADVLPSFLRPFGQLALFPLYRKAKACLKGASAIWAVSNDYLKWGLRYAARNVNQIDLVAPIGYASKSFGEEQLKTANSYLKNLGVSNNKIIVWFIGMFGRTYDIATVIEAARLFQHENNTKIQFVLSGVGDNLKTLKEQAAGLSNLIFSGWLDQVQTMAMMKIASIGLMAYAPEAPQSLPNKFFEFLSAGLPLCSSLQGESVNVIEENNCGILYEAGSATSLKESLIKLCSDSEKLKQMGAASKRLFEENFKAEVVSENMEQKLKDIVRTR